MVYCVFVRGAPPGINKHKFENWLKKNLQSFEALSKVDGQNTFELSLTEHEESSNIINNTLHSAPPPSNSPFSNHSESRNPPRSFFESCVGISAEQDNVTAVVENLNSVKSELKDVDCSLSLTEYSKFCECECMDKLSKAFKEVSINGDKDSLSVHLRGPRDKVEQAQTYIFQTIKALQRFDVDLEKYEHTFLLSCLKSDEPEIIRQLIQTEFRASNTFASLQSEGTSCYLFHPAGCESGIELLKGLISSKQVPLSKEYSDVVTTDEWKFFIESLKQKHYRCYVKSGNQIVLVIAGLKSKIDQGESCVLSFLDQNVKMCQTVRCSYRAASYIKMLDKEVAKGLSLVKWDITFKNGGGIEVTGKREDCIKAEAWIRNRVSSYYEPPGGWEVRNPGFPEFFRAQENLHFLDTIQEQTDCLVLVDNDDFKVQAAMVTKTPPQPTSQAQYHSTAPHITVIEKNIIDQPADVIVNSTTANGVNVVDGSAISRAIRDAAGKQLQDECNTIPEALKCTWGVVATKGYNLPCKNIYHAMIAGWDFNDETTSRSHVKEVVAKCLTMATKARRTSIAFPPIGCGGFNIPPYVLAESIEEEVNAIGSNTSLQHVYVVVPPSETYLIQIFKDKLKANVVSTSGILNIEVCCGNIEQQPVDVLVNSLGDMRKPLSECAKSIKQGITLFEKQNSFYVKDVKVLVFQKDMVSDFKNKLHSTTAPQSGTIAIGPIIISVFDGDITKQLSEVYVNSVSKEMDLLESGRLAKAITEGAGDSILAQFYDPHRKFATDWRRVTEGGNLKCDIIIHVSPEKAGVRKCVENALEMAEMLQKSSVTFPALGTGSQDASTSARNIREGILSFLEQNPRNVTKVQVVVFDQSKLNIFREEICNNLSTNTHSKDFGIGKQRLVSPKSKLEPRTMQDQVVTFYFCALSPSNVKNAQKQLENLVRTNGECSEISDSRILRLDADFQNEIKSFNQVVAVNMDLREGKIKVSGVTKVVRKVILEIQRILGDFNQAETINKLVQWMYSVQRSNSFVAFGLRNNMKLEAAFEVKDNNGKLEIPGLSVNFWSERGSYQDSMIEVFRVDQQKNFPKTWTPMKRDDNCITPNVPENCSEFKEVKLKFLNTGTPINSVVQLQRIQNCSHYAQFQAKKEEVKRELKSLRLPYPPTRELYHGTTNKITEKICKEGFNRSFAGKNATKFGQGMYFAVQSQYCHSNAYAKPDKWNVRRMFLVEVATGVYAPTPGNKNMITPPVRNPASKTDYYHSVVDNPKSPQMFVVFKDACAYPHYLLTYT
ncbi:protein mono-ADP-ribosyltransferase PARP14-like [Ciona intestinalis]